MDDDSSQSYIIYAGVVVCVVICWLKFYEKSLAAFSTIYMFNLIINNILFELIVDINCFNPAIMFLEVLQLFQHFA